MAIEVTKAAVLFLLGLLALGSSVATALDFAPDSILIVIPGDGRLPQPVPLSSRGTMSFVPLGALARALGVAFAWDPFSYRGWIATDSVRTTFTLDSPVLTHEQDGIQLAAPLSYGERGLLFPVDYLEILSQRWHGDRIVTWQPADKVFHWGADAPSARQIRLAEIGHHSTVRLSAPRAPATTLLWSPAAGLDAILEGLTVRSDTLEIGGARGVFAVRTARGWPGGCRLRLDVAPEALGAQARYEDSERVWQLTGTTSREEVDRGNFRPLQPAERLTEGLLRGPILVSCFVDPAVDPAEGSAALVDLADQIVRTLSDTLMLPAEYLESQSPPADAARANATHARCLIALRLDRYGTGLGVLQIWTATPRLRWEPLERANATSRRPLLWSETPALAAQESQRIASSLASHLESLIGTDKVDVGSRPSRWLEGTTMPALLIYPAQRNDPLSIERLRNPADRAGLARAISFGIAEALTAGAFIEGLP